MFKRQSSLVHATPASRTYWANNEKQLSIGELREWRLAEIAAFSETLTRFENVVVPVLNSRLPEQVGKVTHACFRRLLKTATNQYWVISPHDHDPIGSLQVAIGSDLGSTTSLSHSRACICIDGNAARKLLATGIALDFHPDAFGVDTFALTGVHHMPAMILRCSENRYELYAMRTFAISVWEWLIDAASSFGAEIVESEK